MLSKEEDSLKHYLSFGQDSYLQGKYIEAQEYLIKYIQYIKDKGKMTPNLANAYDTLGKIHEALGDDNKARQYHKKASEIDSQCASAWNNLGLQYCKMARGFIKDDLKKSICIMLKAKVCFTKATQNLKNGEPLILHSLAYWYELYSEELREINKEIFLKQINFCFNRAFQFYAEAFELSTDENFRAAIKQNFFEYLAQYGHYVYQKTDYAKAMRIYQYVLNENNENIIVLNQMGMCFYKQKNYAAAIDWFKKILENTTDQQDQADAWLNIADSYQLTHNKEEAQRAILLAEELAPGDEAIIELKEKLFNIPKHRATSAVSQTASVFQLKQDFNELNLSHNM